MANSKYAYVRSFELPDLLLPGTFIVLRLDGHAFHRFSDAHAFAKPNDPRALQLMDRAAQDVMHEYPDVILGFGESDEFSFLLRRTTTLYTRRSSKLSTLLTSLFTSSYVFHWPHYFPSTPLQYPPSFDGRIVLYPGKKEVRDYFAWRQADTHINNLYNTVFWALVLKGGQSTTEAHATLRGTFSKQKHEILFSQFGINYNTLDERYRKGSVLVRTEIPDEECQPNVRETSLSAAPIEPSASSEADTVLTEEEADEIDSSESPSKPPITVLDIDSDEAAPAPQPEVQEEKVKAETSKVKDKKDRKKLKEGAKAKLRTRIDVLHCDIIKDAFWEGRPGLLEE